MVPATADAATGTPMPAGIAASEWPLPATALPSGTPLVAATDEPAGEEDEEGGVVTSDGWAGCAGGHVSAGGGVSTGAGTAGGSTLSLVEVASARVRGRLAAAWRPPVRVSGRGAPMRCASSGTWLGSTT